ncbi:MAG: hypothetical protein SNJ81_19105 [Cyanobacteriota bacterium]
MPNWVETSADAETDAETVDISPNSATKGGIGIPQKGEKKPTVDVAIPASPKTLIFNQ